MLTNQHDSYIINVHHIGIVVDDVRKKSEIYQESFGFVPESGVIHEVNQQVYVQFLILLNFRIELIEPVDINSPVYKFLTKGGKINHICYESKNIEESISFLRKQHGMIPISFEWSASIENCRIGFLAKPNGEVVELIQPFEGFKYFSSINKE
jgi:methylmalonyl-CoA/ethylmalonyl-CoA epimerase